MKKKKTKQLYIVKLGHPFEAVNQNFYKNEALERFCQSDNFKFKKFIGSDWSIKDSGFIFYGPKDLNVSFSLINIEINDFIRVNKYLITHLNGKKIIEEIILLVSFIRNTTDNNTIVEIRLEYNDDIVLKNIEKIVSISSIKTLYAQTFSKIFIFFKDKKINRKKDLLSINHSFIIKKNYKEAFQFFNNYNNLAKSIKTDKVWKIISENKKNNDNYKDFYVKINDKITIHYHVISIEEKNNEKIEIVYNKTSNFFPSLNYYLKFSFFNISKDICFFLYETHLPSNISSSVYQIVSYYLYYCNKKSKNLLEK